MTKRHQPSSFFAEIIAGELNGCRVQKRPHLAGLSSDSGTGTGVLALEHQGTTTPPLAISFCKTSWRSHLLLVSDEDGYVGFYDTRRRLPSLAASLQKTGDAVVREWVAHNNAIFDVCWIKEHSEYNRSTTIFFADEYNRPRPPLLPPQLPPLTSPPLP